MRFSLSILLWLCSATLAFAGELDYSQFTQIPVQADGRIKPLEIFAAGYRERFLGSAKSDTSPIAWLAETIFNPAKALEQPVFLVKDADVQEMLGLSKHTDNLYNFAEISEALSAHHDLIESLQQKTEPELSPAQKSALTLNENAGLFAQITLSCTLFLPLNIDWPQTLATQQHLAPRGTFTDYQRSMPDIQRAFETLIKRKGKNTDLYTPEEKQLAQAFAILGMTSESSQNNVLLRVIPPSWKSGEWLSPWAVFHNGQGAPDTAELMALWRELAASYQEKDAARWLSASQTLREKMQSAPGVRPYALTLESLYYQIDPPGSSVILYIIGFALTLFAISGAARSDYVRRSAILFTGAGALLHMAGIAARIYILQRPPVGTLYESLLFVSLIAVLFGLFLESKLRNHLGLLVATLAGSLLLFLSQSFGGSDTMGVLVAVLGTNFWLATHVLCITTGYGFGIVAGIIAHAYLIAECRNRDHAQAQQILRGGYGAALIALLFASLGTILGGIWADQSWGRFWGWDPKENGALEICLWLIWLLHGRISGHMRERGFAALLALLNVVIALSWIGVNLLSTGLHSYGFTDKAAFGLAAFCAGEFAFVAITYFILWRRERAAH